MSINQPHTYLEWVQLLELLEAKSDDNVVLTAMQQGTLEWHQGVAERFTQRLHDVIESRIERAQERFQKEGQYARGNEGLQARALLTLRNDLSFLDKIVNIPAIPETPRSQFQKMIQNAADLMQSSLEKSAKRQDRSGKLLQLIRQHKVNTY